MAPDNESGSKKRQLSTTCNAVRKREARLKKLKAVAEHMRRSAGARKANMTRKENERQDEEREIQRQQLCIQQQQLANERLDKVAELVKGADVNYHRTVEHRSSFVPLLGEVVSKGHSSQLNNLASRPPASIRFLSDDPTDHSSVSTRTPSYNSRTSRTATTSPVPSRLRRNGIRLLRLGILPIENSRPRGSSCSHRRLR